MIRLEAQSGPRMVMNITDTERAIAKEVKDDFKKVLQKLDSAVDVIVDLRDAIVLQRPEREELNKKYKGRLLRYRRKIRKVFNEFLTDVKHSLEKLSKISDPDMIRLREIIIAEIGELSSGAEAIIDLLEETDRENFTKTLEAITSQMEKRQKSIIDVIDNQLFNHIDHDIFGKLKISELRFRIMRRSRIVRGIISEKMQTMQEVKEVM